MVTTRHTNPGWLGRLLHRYHDASTERLALGFPAGTEGAGARYPDGTPLLMVAAVQQFGSPSRQIPQRDYMTPGAVAAMGDTAEIRKLGVMAINNGKATATQVLEKMGPFAEAAQKRVIAEFTDPPNAPSTIARKGDDNPLEDTGMLRNSVTYVVRSKQ